MKLKTKIIALASTALLFVGTAFGITLSQGRANAEEWNANVAEWQWQEEYEFGSTVTVPAYTVSANGKDVEATTVVTYPDGTKTTSAEIALKQAGVYTVSYFANVDGKEYTKTVTFEVGYKSYYVTSSDSIVEYGTYTGFGADTEQYADYVNDGLLVRLANGDSLEFSHLIDVKDLTLADSIISGFITPDEFNAADFDRFVMKLTDSKDPNVYFEIEVNRWVMGAGNAVSSGKASSFVSAGGNGQDMVGYEEGKGLHVNDGVGAGVATSFVAVAYKSANGSIGATWNGVDIVEMAPSRYPFTLSYDYTSNSTYVSGTIISDFDSSDYYNTLWYGFPSGKARLSIYATGYNSSTANFCLTNVYGLEDLTDTSFTENEAPEITVDSEYTATTMPNAKIGTAYKIPTATAYDSYAGNCAVETQVWYNYTSNEPVSVSINNGTFTPERKGYYSIVYTAKDNFGQIGSVIYPVYAVTETPTIVVENPATIPTGAVLGNTVTIDAPIMSGGTGNLTYKITLQGPDASFDITDSFIPETAGTWTVMYTVTDYIGQTATSSFAFEAVAGDIPVINQKPVLPKIYLSGVTYILPEIYANDYSSGKKVSVLCDVEIEYAGGKKETKKAGDEFVPTVATNGEKIKVTYFSGAASLETVEIPTVIVKDGTNVLVKNYVYGENITIVGKDPENNKNYRGLHLYATNAGDTVWTFANPQVAELFSLKLSSLEGKTRFDALEFNLTDTENPEESITLKAVISNTSVKLINGSFEADVAMSLLAETIFNVSYSDNKFRFENMNISVSEYDNGEAFNGFSSNKVYITVTTRGAKSGAGYMLMEVSGSAITNNDRDPNAPSFAILGDNGGSYSIGSSYTLAPAIANDTYAPETSLKVTVRDPKGNIVTDKNGVVLENVEANNTYIISLNRYGLYSIAYTASEENWGGKINEYINYVNVIDEIDPVITVTSNYTTTAKVGDLLIFPNITVSDNITDSANITVDRFVQNPTGRTVRLSTVSNCVRATYAGRYILSIMAKDEYGNAATVYFEIVVTE